MKHIQPKRIYKKRLRFESLERRRLLAVADLSVATGDAELDLTQGKEGSSPIVFTVTLSEENTTGAPITFDLDDMSQGTATSGVDYSAIASGAKISVPNGSTIGTLQVNVIDDFLIEATETLTARISNPSNPTTTIGTSTVVATIGDNDTAGVTLTGADSLSILEPGDTDTYTIALDSIPTGAVEITATADPQLEISTDGVSFATTQVLSLTDKTPETITVRIAASQGGGSVEDVHISHAITGTVIDANYPDVTVEDLYTQTGTDRSFQDLIDSGDLPTGSNTTAGITGSTIDVDNSILEQGPNANDPIPQNLFIHTLANSRIPRQNFSRWTRWYQEDGNTQVFRVFEGEENVRNSRALAARIEAFQTGLNKGVWHDFTARYTIVKPESMSLFQSFQSAVEWSVHLGMSDDGSVNFTHRRANGGGSLSIPLAEDMIGKSFDVTIRDNGFDYEVYFNGELKGRGQYTRPDATMNYRWGMYRGSRPMNHDALVFVSGANIQSNTSAPAALAPYRPATTSLSIASATVNGDFEPLPPQDPFIQQTVQDGTRILVEEFDLGGTGVAYFDTTTGNLGGQARPNDDVDLYAGSIVLGNVANGEWLEFTRDVVPGIYDIDVRAWSNNDNAKAVRILIANDSTEEPTQIGSITIPNTSNVRISQTIQDVDLTAWGGQDKVIRVQFDGGALGYDWIEFKSQTDFGDAPASYSTLLANDGARHAAIGPRLGATLDGENNGAPSSNADGDGSDEDGVMFGGIGVNNSMAAVNIELGGASEGKIDAWIDFNRNGTFDEEEKILNSREVNQAIQTLNYELPDDLPGGITVGDAFARVRISTAGGLGPNGYAPDGEVEDYVVSIISPPKVESVIINADDPQRSSVDSVRVTFDRVVDIDTQGEPPFQFIESESRDVVTPLAPDIDDSSGKTVVDFQFDPTSTHVTSFGSLEDGDYELIINAASVSYLEVGLDGDKNGTSGDNYVMDAVDGLFRKYGDADGDGSVGLADFAALRGTFGKSHTDPGYLAELDSDGNDKIGLSDFAAFRANFGS